MSNPKDLEPIWRRMTLIQIQREIEWLYIVILQKKCHEHWYRSFLLFLVCSCRGLFLGIASNSAWGLRWKMINDFLYFSDKGTMSRSRSFLGRWIDNERNDYGSKAAKLTVLVKEEFASISLTYGWQRQTTREGRAQSQETWVWVACCIQGFVWLPNWRCLNLVLKCAHSRSRNGHFFLNKGITDVSASSGWA